MGSFGEGGTHLGTPAMGTSGGGGPPCRVGQVGRLDDIFIHRLAPGYDKQEVDAFRRAVRDTFRGKEPPP